MKFWIKIIGMIFWIVGLAACSPEAGSGSEDAAPAVSQEKTALVVNVDGLRLRDRAGEEGRVIRELLKGTVLFDLGEVSSFTTPLRLRGIDFDEPWLKVVTEDGTEGWVYGGALHFELDRPSELARLLMEKRLQTFFGKGLTSEVGAYRLSFHEIREVEDFVRTYRRGQSLRDTLVGLLGSRIEVGERDELPDLFWLSEALPGYVPQLVAEGTAYYLFADFRQFLERARRTPGREDDAFVAFCLEVFPEDSIEYFYPAWSLQTWDYGGHSLLGRGIHRSLLAEIDRLWEGSDRFQPELRRYKLDLLNDITRPNVTYWEERQAVVAEVDSILADDYGCFSRQDRVALRTRRLQFAQPDSFAIEFNHQAGLYE